MRLPGRDWDKERKNHQREGKLILPNSFFLGFILGGFTTISSMFIMGYLMSIIGR